MKIVPENDDLSAEEARLVREFRAVPKGCRVLAFDYMENLQRNGPGLCGLKRPALRLVKGPSESPDV